MGRHHNADSAPSQRGVVAALVAGAIVIAGGAFALGKGTGSDGSGDTSSGTGCTAGALRVEVTPELADLVKAQLATATKADPCHRYEVTSLRSSSVASRIRQGRAPDAWIADSSVWLDQTTAGSSGSAVKADWVAGGSLAHSPVVLANPVKSKDNFSGEFTSWIDLVNKGGAIHLANPHLDTASRLAFLASRGDTPTTKDVAAGQRIILLSRFAATGSADLLAGVQDPTKSNTTRSEPFPLSEQALAAYAASAPGTLAAITPKAGTLSLDYPWVPAPDLSPELKETADAGLRALTSAGAVDAFTRAGFRSDDDAGGPTIDGVAPPTITALKQMAPAARLDALRQWDVLKADARMLVIMDVSGSMKTVAKDTGGKTRATVAEESLITAAQRLPDGSEVGGWIFSTDKGGKGKDWAAIAPIARLDEPEGTGTHRDALVAALKKFQTYISGDTGLYDTTAAAFEEMTKTYDPEYFNSVVIITDGKNDDPGGGLDLDQLLAHIKKGHDPTRPVRIVTIGMGEADTKVLKTISTATGGTTYTANTSDDLLTVFVQALLAREPAQAP
ncbi:von Willebrand factor, type A [Janibacter sp. HTCC2649]|uniref:substrate-binding domain-containing protein n=1 Tax=Janibacter sp. HTCC2649 TaxID=313589 RepID=UPI0000670C63|nr:substrate-binding domain-containing protein [Janibacter sp. HTCC2649]EAQ00826.1 von Willebrand factor, type A [Janibacter sp. HTCC2649]